LIPWLSMTILHVVMTRYWLTKLGTLLF